MKLLVTKNRPVKLMVLLMAVTLLGSCSKSKDTPAGYPKEVSIEYRITSSTPGFNTGEVTYINADGGNTTIDDAPIPFSKKLKRNVNKLDHANVNLNAGAGTARLEILVNDKVVESKTFTSTSYVLGSIVYLFE